MSDKVKNVLSKELSYIGEVDSEINNTESKILKESFNNSKTISAIEKINNNNNINENIKEKYGKFEINEDYPEEYERYIFDRIKNRIKGPLLMGAHEY